jgi:hypothetical protein
MVIGDSSGVTKLYQKSYIGDGEWYGYHDKRLGCSDPFESLDVVGPPT